MTKPDRPTPPDRESAFNDLYRRQANWSHALAISISACLGATGQFTGFSRVMLIVFGIAASVVLIPFLLTTEDDQDVIKEIVARVAILGLAWFAGLNAAAIGTHDTALMIAGTLLVGSLAFQARLRYLAAEETRLIEAFQQADDGSSPESGSRDD